MDYRYVAYSEDRKLVKGKISGASEAVVTQRLLRQGFQPITINAKAGLPPIEEIFPSLFKITTKEVIMFSRQLATLLDAGISIVPAMQLIQEQTSNRLFKAVIAEITTDLRAGTSFSEAVSKHEKVFGELYCQLIATGERIGGVENLLRQGADYLEKDTVIKKKIKKALTYPVIVLAVAVIVISVLMVVVMPKMTEMFDTMDTTLPPTTKMLINATDFVGVYKMHMFVGIVALVAAVVMYFRQPSGRYQLARFLITAPIVGKANLMSEMARFSRTLALLVRAGLPLPEIIGMSSNVSGNLVVKQSLEKVRTGLLQGEGLSEPMSRDATFPNLLTQMVMVGEESGRLESTLETVATSYETEADDTVTGMISMIEPVMTVVLAVVIGFIAVSVIAPMYSITEGFE